MGLESFYTAKETINKMKRQTSEWEEIIASETTDEINLQNIQILYGTQHKKQTTPSENGRRSKQTFLQRIHTDGQQTYQKMAQHHFFIK